VAFLSLQQAAQGKTIVFFLIALLVGIRAEIASAGPSFQQRQLFAAVQASHAPIIGSSRELVNSSQGCFYTVKHLSTLSKVVHLRLKAKA
jgi:hypothetical protein